MNRFGTSTIVAACLSFSAVGAMADPLALLIGNERYEDYPDVRDATDVLDLVSRLNREGVDTIELRNATENRTRSALYAFEGQADGAEALIVVLSGRFVHSATDSFFLPTDLELASLSRNYDDLVPISVILSFLADRPGYAVLALATDGDQIASRPGLEPGLGDIVLPQGVTLLEGTPQAIANVLTSIVR